VGRWQYTSDEPIKLGQPDYGFGREFIFSDLFSEGYGNKNFWVRPETWFLVTFPRRGMTTDVLGFAQKRSFSGLSLEGHERNRPLWPVFFVLAGADYLNGGSCQSRLLDTLACASGPSARAARRSSGCIMRAWPTIFCPRAVAGNRDPACYFFYLAETSESAACRAPETA
jgi:hypothetical protein